MAESFKFTKFDESIAIGIAILFLKIVFALVLAIRFVGCIGIAIANTF